MNSVFDGFTHGGGATIALQPVFDIETEGAVLFYESLLRIPKTPDTSFHVRLLALAEEFGFIHNIDLLVMGLAVGVLRRNPDITASINVSQRSILEDGQQLIRRIAASKVCDRLIVEITESAEIPSAWVAAFAAGVREIGCKLAVDDFETGFADDVLVRAVKPNLIKVVIDDTSARSRARVGRTIDLAGEIGASVVGERIDSNEKIELARAMGVRYLQGYSFASPILAMDFQKYLGRSLDAAVTANDGGASGIRLDLANGFKTLHGNGNVRLVQKTGC